MLSIEEVLSSAELYKNAFEEGLIDCLNNRTAGTFILACANIYQHPELLKKHNTCLSEVYTYIKDYYQRCSHNNEQPNDTDDDILVMNQIIAIDIKNLKPPQTKQLKIDTAIFQINFNQLRSFRPTRMSSVQNVYLNNVFNQNSFHFDKLFLKKEMFAEGIYNDRQISLFYNKFPFVEYHALLVVDKALHRNQFLTKDYLEYSFQLQSSGQQKIPELVIAYNSIGAGASVNHLHFHIFLETKPLAVFSPGVIHNGGSEPYPVLFRVFNNIEECWNYLQQLHDANTPYNLLFKNSKIFCLPRKPPSKVFPDFNVSSYGWSEMAGIFTLSNKDSFAQVSIDDLLETIRSVSINI